MSRPAEPAPTAEALPAAAAASSRARSLAAAGIGLAVGAALLLAAEARVTRARLSATSPWCAPLFAGFGALDREIGARQAGSAAQLDLPGFPAGQPVRLEIVLSTAWRRPFEAGVWVNDRLAGGGRVRGLPTTLRVQGSADREGWLHLRISGPAGAAAHFYGLEATWQRRGWAWRALAPVLALLGLAALLAAWGLALPPGAAAGALAAALALAWALGHARLGLLAQAPGLGLSLGLGLLAAWALTALGWPRVWGRWFVLALVLRSWLAAQPFFPCADCSFHYHRLNEFERGHVTTSAAPGPGATGLSVPYPPAFYALLGPVERLAGSQDHQATVRRFIFLLETAAALLVAAVLRAGGASRGAAAAGAAALACMPEGLLVGVKGIGPNVLANGVSVAVLWALVRPGTSAAVLAALLALAFLSHLGAALTLAAAVLACLLLGARHDPGLARRGAWALFAAVAVAWLSYYREVAALAGHAVSAVVHSAGATGPDGWGWRGLRAAKTLQDLLLKFGLGPLLLAWIGWRRRQLSPALARAAGAWLGVAGLAGLLAWLSPFPLRFEYFALPVVALLAGAGADARPRGGGTAWAQAALGLALAVQLVLGVAVFVGRWDILDVVLESPHWLLRDRLLGFAVGT